MSTRPTNSQQEEVEIEPHPNADIDLLCEVGRHDECMSPICECSCHANASALVDYRRKVDEGEQFAPHVGGMIADFDPATFRVSDELIDYVMWWGSEIDKGWWEVARGMAEYLDRFPAALRTLARPLVIRQVAEAMGKREQTIREALRTAEVFAPTFTLDPDADKTVAYHVEEDDRYTILKWSHFTKAARAGSRETAVLVLDTLVASAPGRPPRVGATDRIVRHVRAGGATRRLSDGSDMDGVRVADLPLPDMGDGIDAEDGERNGRDRITLWVEESVGGALRVTLPDGAGFAAGDTVVVVRLAESEE